ncbi:unnamed protein product [Effrenium voratum]|nr:unnamed protein product [Effrenium voratum]
MNADEVSKDVVLTYCGLSNLGIAYTPKLGGKSLHLHPMPHMETNLVMYDKTSMEPVQQLWGITESRMGGQYSTQGLKPNLSNPIQFIYDGIVDLIFRSSTVYQKTKPVFPTLKIKDNRLPNKDNVYVLPLEGRGRKVVVAYFP